MLGHILPWCEYEEPQCVNVREQRQQLGRVMKRCPDVKWEHHRVEIDLCYKCKASCHDRQKMLDGFSKEKKEEMEAKGR